MSYGQKVSEKFLASGIDVLIQTTPNNAPKSRNKVNDIMTEHMVPFLSVPHPNESTHCYNTKSNSYLDPKPYPNSQLLT